MICRFKMKQNALSRLWGDVQHLSIPAGVDKIPVPDAGKHAFRTKRNMDGSLKAAFLRESALSPDRPKSSSNSHCPQSSIQFSQTSSGRGYAALAIVKIPFKKDFALSYHRTKKKSTSDEISCLLFFSYVIKYRQSCMTPGLWQLQP